MLLLLLVVNNTSLNKSKQEKVVLLLQQGPKRALFFEISKPAVPCFLMWLIGERAKRATHYQGCTNSSWCGTYIYIYIYIYINVKKI